MRLHHVEKVVGTPAPAIIARAWVDLLEQGLIQDHMIPIGWDDSAFYITDGDRFVAVLSYFAAEWNGGAHVKVGWVAPEYRRRGLYRRLWSALVERAREKGWMRIEGATAANNAPLQAFAASVGRELTAFSYSYAVPLGDNGTEL